MTTQRAATPSANKSPVTPIQSIQLTQADLKDENLGILNSYLQTLTNAVNNHGGANGPTMLPAGIDVAGARVKGVGTPVDPTDAVSAGHVADNYSAAAQRSQFDIGGPQALKGLTYLYMQNKANAIVRTPAGGGFSVTLPGGTIIQWGTSPAAAPTGVGVYQATAAITFPVPFTTSVNVFCGPDNLADNTGNFPFECIQSPPTLTGFTANFTVPTLVGGGGAAGITNVVHCSWFAIGY